MNKNLMNELPVNGGKIGTHSFDKFFPLIFAVCFIVWRLCFLFFTHPQYLEGSYEELYRGTAAREFLNGSFSSLWSYRPDSYSGGYYVIVILLAGFLKLFGFSMLAFKSISILWGTLALLLWMQTLKRYVNPRAAWIFGILYIFSPQTVTGLSSVVLGDHAETIFLSAVSALLFFRLREPLRPRTMGTLITLSLLAGFSLWFAYIYAVTLAAMLIFAAINRPKVEIRYTLATLASFAAGFSLWGFFYWKNEFQSLVVQGAPLWKSFSLSSLLAPLSSWREFFPVRLLLETRHRPLSGSFYGSLLVLYGAFLTAGAIFSFTKIQQSGISRKSPEILFLIYIVLLALACQLYDDQGLRYLLPGYPFVIAWIAAGFSRVELIRIAKILLIGLAVCGVLTTGFRFSLSQAGEFLKQQPYAQIAPVYGENV